uniref:Uncharacterized protein n=1 Tax=viral metagenome TaxID=1070528 RepID=A0A6M3JLA2_9ZZZZ
MEYLSIRNWDTYQHYKKRNPPWIKLYNTLLQDYEYTCLQDDSKLLLISLFMLASRCDNKIPNDPEWIKSQSSISKPVDLTELIDMGFIRIGNDSKPIASCLQDDSKLPPSLESQTETETEAEVF